MTGYIPTAPSDRAISAAYECLGILSVWHQRVRRDPGNPEVLLAWNEAARDMNALIDAVADLREAAAAYSRMPPGAHA